MSPAARTGRWSTPPSTVFHRSAAIRPMVPTSASSRPQSSTCQPTAPTGRDAAVAAVRRAAVSVRSTGSVSTRDSYPESVI